MINCNCKDLHQYCNDCRDARLSEYQHIIKQYLKYEFKTYQTFEKFEPSDEYRVAVTGMRMINNMSIFDVIKYVNTLKREVIKEVMLHCFPEHQVLIYMMTEYIDTV